MRDHKIQCAALGDFSEKCFGRKGYCDEPVSLKTPIFLKLHQVAIIQRRIFEERGVESIT